MLHLLLGLAAGCAITLQSGANARLRRSVGSPLVSALLSFAIGTAALLAVVPLVDGSLALPAAATGGPWWIWTGGALGVIFLTTNMLLIPRIGAVETGVFPLVGQVASGLLIDHLALFEAPRTTLDASRLAGAALVLGGAALVALAGRHRADAPVSHPHGAPNHWPWRLLGVAAGALQAAQTAINGHLGVLLASPRFSALVSFAVGTALLLVLNLAARSRPRLVVPTGQHGNPWWMWAGGLLGAFYVAANAALAPAIGAGLTVVLTLLGMTAASVAVDHFGLLGSARRRTTPLRLVGLLVLVVGVATIRIL